MSNAFATQATLVTESHVPTLMNVSTQRYAGSRWDKERASTQTVVKNGLPCSSTDEGLFGNVSTVSIYATMMM